MAYVVNRDGRWYLVWIDERGVKRRKVSEAKTKTEAQRLADELQRKAERVHLGLEEAAPEPITFEQLAAMYERDAIPALRSPGTARSRLRKHLLPAFKDKRLADITPGAVEAFLAHKVTEGYEPQTREHLRKDLRRIFNFAIANRLARHNPGAEAGKVDVPERAVNYLQEAEVSRLLAAIPIQWRPAACVAVFCGLRKGEVAGIQVRDVDLDGRALTIHRSHTSRTTKGARSRVVPIPEPLVPILAGLIDNATGSRLFPKLTPNTKIADVIRRAMSRAGLVEGYRHKCRRKGCEYAEEHKDNARTRRCPIHGMMLWPIPKPLPIRFKELRSTWGTLAYDATGDIRFVQMVLGHTDPKITERHYASRRAKKMLQQANQVWGGYESSTGVPSATSRTLPPEASSGNAQSLREDAERAMGDSNPRPLAPEATTGRFSPVVVTGRPSQPGAIAGAENSSSHGAIVPTDQPFQPKSSTEVPVRLLTLAEVAKVLRVSRATAWRLVTRGEIPALRVDHTIRVSAEHLEAFIRRQFGR